MYGQCHVMLHPLPDMESIWWRNYGVYVLLLLDNILYFRDLVFVDIFLLYILAKICSHGVKIEWALAFSKWHNNLPVCWMRHERTLLFLTTTSQIMVYLSDPLIVQLKHDLIWEYTMTPIVLSSGQTSIKCVHETMGTIQNFMQKIHVEQTPGLPSIFSWLILVRWQYHNTRLFLTCNPYSSDDFIFFCEIFACLRIKIFHL